MEGRALVRLYGEGSPPASGTKAQTGHTLGAAGVIESLIAIEALERGHAPGNVGLLESDLDPRIRLLRADAPLARARVALKVSAGFGGINAAMVFRR
jgi:3-oxoacyl-(acyl-carrier-protein) synthase